MKNERKKLAKHELKKVINDVEIVRRTASVVLELDDKNNLSVHENFPDYAARLGGTIVVIGPTNLNDTYFENAVLLEVGIGPSRPYRQGWIRLDSSKRWFSERKKCFQISTDQYLQCAPIIFGCIQKMTDVRVAQWKCNFENPFFIPGTRQHWSHRGKKMYVDDVKRTRVPATRFSVSIKDEFILADIFWAELEANNSLREQLRGLAGFIDKRLKRNRDEGYRDFSKLKAKEDIEKALFRLPLCLRIEMLDRFFKKTASRIEIYNDLAKLIGWDFEKTKERRLAEAILPNPQSRTSDMQIRIITGLDQEKDCVVFEVAAKNNN